MNTFDANQVVFSAHDKPILRNDRNAFGDLEAMRIEAEGIRQANAFKDLAAQMKEAANQFEENSEHLANVTMRQSRELADTFRALVRKYNETIGEIYDKLDFEK